MKGLTLCFVSVTLASFFSVPGNPTADEREGLRIHPANPRYLTFKGKPFLIIGSGMESLCQRWSRTRRQWYEYLDMLHRNGFNRVRFFPWDFCWQEELLPTFSPWRVIDPKGFDFDLRHFNPKYWSFVRDIISYAAKRDIVVEYILFDYCSLRGREWLKNPLAADNGGAVPGKTGNPGIRIDLSAIESGRFDATWFDPRNGHTSTAGYDGTKATPVFECPSEDDWALVIRAR